MPRADGLRSSGLVAVIGVCGLACAANATNATNEPSATTTIGTPIPHGRVVRLADTTPGSTSGLGSTTFLRVGNEVYFRSLADGGSLWRSNGRPGGTIRLDTGVLHNPIAIGNTIVYLRGGTAVHGAAGLCVLLQGTTAPVVAVEGAFPLPYAYSRVGAGNCVVAATRVFYSKGVAAMPEIWSWDWLTGAEERLTTTTGISLISTREVAAAGGKAFIFGQSATGNGIWASDGTAAGTVRVTSASASPYFTTTLPLLVSDGTRVFFTVSSAGGFKLWASDGTVSGTVAVGNLPASPSSANSMWTADGSSGLYWAGEITTSPTLGTQLWHFGGSAGSAEHLLSFARGSLLVPLSSGNGASLFVDQRSSYASNANTLWISFGSQGSTFVGPTGIVPTNSATQLPAPTLLTANSGNELYFARTTPTTGTELWHVNVATGAVGMVADLAPGAQTTRPIQIVARDGGEGAVMFSQYPQLRLWSVNPDGSRVRYMTMPIMPDATAKPFSVRNRVFMVLSSTGGIEPWVADLCPADYDNSGSVETADLFAYLNDWLAADPNADFDAPSTGATAPTMSDLIGYLNAWITGCP